MNRISLLALSLWSFGAGAAPLTVVGFNVESGDASDHVISLQLEKSVGVDLWGLADVWDEYGWPERLRRGAGAGENGAFRAILGESGGDSRLLALYREDRLHPLETREITEARATRRGAAPLAVRFRLDDGEEFWFLVVDLSDSDDRRLQQAEALARWSSGLDVPLVAVGTFRFGADKEGGRGDPAMAALLEADWRWARPEEHVGTSCGGRDRVDDLVFLAGPGVGWGARAEVMYPQSNYCPDSGRTSSHRPVLANLETGGGSPVITGSMPARQIRPLFPEELDMSLRSETALANTPAPVPAAAPPTAPASARRAGDLSREALLERLEALEAENRSLRKAIESLPD